LVRTGRLDTGNIDLVGDAGTAVFSRRIFGHDNLRVFRAGIIGKLAKLIARIVKIIGGADTGDSIAGIDANSVEAKAVDGGSGPSAADAFGTGRTDITGSVGNSEAVTNGHKRMILMGENFVAMAAGRGDRNNITIGSADVGSERAKIDSQLLIFEAETKIKKSIVDVLKAGFNNVAVFRKKAGGILTDGVGKLIVGGSFTAGGDIKVAPVDNVGIGGEVLSINKSRRKVKS